MATSLSGIASYQQTSQIWKKDQNIAAKEKEGEKKMKEKMLKKVLVNNSIFIKRLFDF